MRRFFYDNFQEYLKEKGVKKIDFILKDNESLSKRGLDERVFNQIETINQFHKKACGFNGYLKYRINNDTCKAVEEYKVQIKRLNKHMDKIKRDGPDGAFEEFLQKNGDENLQRAQKCIEHIYNNNYMELIARSMENVEICLTDVGFDNLQQNKSIEIVNFYDISYNMVEMDGYFLLSKLKRKGANLKWQEHIKHFCRIEGLGEDSENFILAMMSYPHEFMKIYDKYRKNKRNWNDEDYIRKMNKSIDEDGETLIKI